ncbi:MAG TPA: restriction endonuclease [Chitinophagales bacterium]|nr:restriction endonuclease [Chitinophagales bacterium]
MKNIYVVRADFGRHTQAFKDNGYVGIGWFDFLMEKGITREEIKEHYFKKYPKDVPLRAGQNSGQVLRFVNGINVGDIVLTPYSTNKLLVGEVISENYYEQDDSSPYGQRKKVNWFDQRIDRYELSVPLQNTLRSSLTVYKVNNGREILQGIGFAPKSEVVQQADINIYKIIKEKLLELAGFEFETFVSYLLRAIGFEPTDERQGGVGDGGIDFEGILSIFGVASINLQVQVKAYSKKSISWQEVARFRGAMKRDFQGCFITLSDFQKKAIENANDEFKVPITLINGKKLIDIFIDKYDDIIYTLREEENDDLADKLKFKKALIPL